MPLNDVPQAAQTLAQTQNPIRQNFLTINNAFQIDHVAYVNAADINNGKHNKVTLPVQAAVPAFIGVEDGLYNKVPAAPFPLTGISELFIHKQRNQAPGNVDIPFTASILSTATPAVNSNGWTYLPSGLLLKWGTVPLIASPQTIVYPVAANIPVFSAGAMAILLSQTALNFTGLQSGIKLFTGNNLPVSFQVLYLNAEVVATDQVTYFAIGR